MSNYLDYPTGRRDPDGNRCGRCRRIFRAGCLPPGGPERTGEYAGSYICRDCRDLMAADSTQEIPTVPLF